MDIVSDNIFIFEYSLGNDNVEYRFDVDLHNYGNEIVAIKAKDGDDELYTTDRLDVIEEQLDFVVESTRLEHMLKLIYLDNKPSNKDIDISKNLLVNFVLNGI